VLGAAEVVAESLDEGGGHLLLGGGALEELERLDHLPVDAAEVEGDGEPGGKVKARERLTPAHIF
jgi:hypothetical protein